MKTLSRVLGALALLALSGCPRPPAPKSAATIRAEDLPSDPAELLRRLDELITRGDPVSLENALVVGDRALAVQPGAYEPAWKAAQAAFLLADVAENDKGRRAFFAGKGADYAKLAIAARGDRVEGHYYRALDLGYVAKTRTIGALEMLPDIAAEARAAIAADEKYDGCGPLRLLGAILVKAPGWPSSIGDVEEGEELTGRAVQLCPGQPFNRVYYAEALHANGKGCEADAQLRKVLEEPAAPEWAGQQARARSEAEALRKKVKCSPK